MVRLFHLHTGSPSDMLFNKQNEKVNREERSPMDRDRLAFDLDGNVDLESQFLSGHAFGHTATPNFGGYHDPRGHHQRIPNSIWFFNSDTIVNTSS